MKKLTLLCIAAITCLSLSACGSQTTKKSDSSSKSSSSKVVKNTKRVINNINLSIQIVVLARRYDLNQLLPPYHKLISLIIKRKVQITVNKSILFIHHRAELYIKLMVMLAVFKVIQILSLIHKTKWNKQLKGLPTVNNDLNRSKSTGLKSIRKKNNRPTGICGAV